MKVIGLPKNPPLGGPIRRPLRQPVGVSNPEISPFSNAVVGLIIIISFGSLKQREGKCKGYNLKYKSRLHSYLSDTA